MTTSMSQHVNGLTDESLAAATKFSAGLAQQSQDGMATQTSGGFSISTYPNQNQLGGNYYSWHPTYIYSDKTAKAIEILKKLQAEKVIDVKSVPRFIELVEAISAIL